MAVRAIAAQRRSSKAGAAKEGEDACPAWVRGVKTVLDVTFASLAPPPIEPPVAGYLEEVLLGMIGGVADPEAKVHARRPRLPATKVLPVHRVQALRAVIANPAAHEAGKALFWLVLGGIFGQLRPEALKPCRAALGESWFLLSLQSREALAGDRILEDNVFNAVPYVLAQAIYRLFVDGFVEDRKNFIKGAEELILKITQVVHFELLGFQVALETVRRMRVRLFVRGVLKCPHVDQNEIMRGRRRQAILDSHSALASSRPLEFGGDCGNEPLEEAQLERLVQGSEQRRKKEAKELASGKRAWELEVTPVPPELSVERHQNLGQVGDALYAAHMRRLAKIFGEEVEDCQGQGGEHSDDDSPAESAASETTPMTATTSWVRPVQFAQPPDPGEDQCESAADSPKSNASPSRRSVAQKLWRRGLAVAKLSLAREDPREKKDREAKTRKFRQDRLQKKIFKDPLPRDLSERELSTTWVSPTTMNLAGEQDRGVLRKPPAEACRLKMEIPKTLRRPSSVPALRPTPSRGDGTPKLRSPPRIGLEAALSRAATTALPTAQASSAASAHGSAPECARVSARDPAGAAAAPATVAALAASAGAASGLAGVNPRASVLGATGGSASSAPLPRVGGKASKERSEAVETPARLTAAAMKKRLEAQVKAFQQESFATYMKEHDVLTGIKRLTMDGAKLREDEKNYVKKMERLVGGAPKRLIGPEAIFTRQRKAAASAAAAQATAAGA